MKLFGGGRIAIAEDYEMAQHLGWRARQKSAGEPETTLTPYDGDPRVEPWIAPRRFDKGSGPEALWQRSKLQWSYLSNAPGVERYLLRLAQPRTKAPSTIGIDGLGRVGGTAAAVLAALSVRQSGIGEILIHDSDAANQERWLCELGSISSWREFGQRPKVRAVSLDEMLACSDAFLFAAAKSVPPVGSAGDVRLPQFEPNRIILDETLRIAKKVGFSGLFFIISDPVECLAQAAFHDSNTNAAGSFIGGGLAPERIAGLALGVMWGRAVAAAHAAGCGERIERFGVPYGPHSTEVLVFDNPEHPDLELSHKISEAARHGNYHLREIGYLPYLGPAISSIGLTLPRLLAGREALVSVSLDGIYFGAPAKMLWGVHPVARPVAPEVKSQLIELHSRLLNRMKSLGLIFAAC